MNISLSWLQNYIQCELSENEIAEFLTHCGLEVEGIETWEEIPGSLHGVVVGEVMDLMQHPGADRLKLTKVNVGAAEPLSIVCGASNVAMGQKVLVATIGSVLHTFSGEKIEIKKSKIRGEVSEGMICAEDELGLGNGHEGIMVLEQTAVPGTPAASLLNLMQDRILSIGLTPNRIDAASHFGVARDLAAVLKNRKIEFKLQKASPAPPSEKNELSVFPIDVLSKSCIRYSGILIQQVTVKESPSWLRNRLLSIGVKPINNIVDVTNFVLHEMGQPLHAFDAAKLSGDKIIVRNAKTGETLITLDGIERKLTDADLMICDEDKPLCLAGIFGGKNSGISESTNSVFLESACFDSVSIRKSSKHHGLKTDASFRYERGADPEITVEALYRAAQLICEISGGRISTGLNDVYPETVIRKTITLKESFLEQVIGLKIPSDEVSSILTSLDFVIISHKDEIFNIEAPTYRIDVTRPIDVVEEVLRIYGYNLVQEPESIRIPTINGAKASIEIMENKTRNFLLANGFFEAMNLSLTASAYAEKSVSSSKPDPVFLLNPLSSELNMMRQNLLFGLLSNVSYNANRQRQDLSLFEIGRVYGKKENEFSEDLFLGLVLCGKEGDGRWNGNNSSRTVFSLKGVLNSLLEYLGYSEMILENQGSDEYFPELLQLSIGSRPVGKAGEVNAGILQEMGISFPVFYAELNLGDLKSGLKKEQKFKALPKFPEVKRDLALLLNPEVSFRELKDLAFKTEPAFLKEVSLFDVYQGNKIPEGLKSYALSFILCKEDGTLNDKQIESVMGKLLKAFNEKLGAKLRS